MLFDTEGRPPPIGYAAGGPAFIAFPSAHVVGAQPGFRNRRLSSTLAGGLRSAPFCQLLTPAALMTPHESPAIVCEQVPAGDVGGVQLPL